ncbi:MAG: adenylate/guanylate cyclase domain-containing protein [Candidatus Competibacteraceae bacterium]|nr:MAG: adenylate/guanylate cyclase domain-containing protein [Candidatus Competibacteraceae bacterium]
MKLKLGNLRATLEDRAASQRQVAAAILFADICGSTRLFEKHGDWRARQIETRVLEVLTAGTVAHDGVVIKTIGDEIMSRFASAQQAVRAACEMHRVLKEDKDLAELNIAVKIGLHYGPVLVEKGDLFGDAVNVAARMVALAKADQIITTRETVACLPTDLAQMTRDLGRSWVRGKQDEMDIVEIIWHDSSSLTQMASGGQEELRGLLFARLVLDYRERTIEVVPGSQTFTMGRGERNNLVVDRELVSRSHADIEFRQGKFILVEHSTNGTYLLLENGARFFVRREEFALHDCGVICLGQAVADDNPDLIHYQCVHG